EGPDGVDAAVEVVQRRRAQLGDGVEVLHGHALVGVVAAEAVEDEVVEILPKRIKAVEIDILPLRPMLDLLLAIKIPIEIRLLESQFVSYQRISERNGVRQGDIKSTLNNRPRQ